MNKYIKLLIESYFKNNKKLNLYEIPILHRAINEVSKYDIPEAHVTKPTDETLEYVINNSILDPYHIEDSYYYKAENIAISVIAYWDIAELTDSEYNKIVKLFNDCGYYLVYNRIHNSDDGITYKVMYFEPYNLESSLMKYPKYVYHISAIQNDKSIQEYGLLPKSDSNDLTYPDRVYLFTEYDKHAMINHIRSTRTVGKNNDYRAVIYKIKPPQNCVLFLDTRVLDDTGNIVETCVYSYDAIPADSIIDVEYINIKGQGI